MKNNNYYKYKNILEKNKKKYAYPSPNSMVVHGTKSKKSKPMQRMKSNIKKERNTEDLLYYFAKKEKQKFTYEQHRSPASTTTLR